MEEKNLNKQRENFLNSIKLDKKTIQLKKECNNSPKTNISSTNRNHISPGMKVNIVQKHHQKTGELTQGIVKDILTNSSNHHRGIKVRLQSGIVGRVQEVLDT